MRSNNTRFQALPFYISKKDWFLYEHGFKFGAHLLISSGRVPAIQFIEDAAEGNLEIYKIDDINNPLGSSTLIDTKTFDTTTFDFENNGGSKEISSFHPTGNVFFADLEAWYYVIATNSGLISEPFQVGCVALQRYKLEWYNTCNNNIGYYDDGWKNELWFDESIVFNVPIQEEEIEKDAFENVIVHKVLKRYSFTKVIPEYMLDAFFSLNSHDTIMLSDNETGETITIHDIAVSNDSGDKEAYINVTVSYRIKGEVTPDNQGCCAPIEFIDETVDPGSGSESCPGFAVTIDETGGDLTYSLENTPVEGTTVVNWSKDGASLGSGSTVSLGGYGSYKVTIRRNGCTVTDTYIYMDPCVLFFLEVTQNDGVINANTVGAPDSVTYKVYDETSSLVASALPYTAVTSGVHTVVATSDGCEKQQNINIDLSDPCAHTAVIVRNGSQLTGSSDDGTATHNWHLDQGSGFGSSLSTDAILNMSENGLYRYTATVDGCEKTATLVVVDLGISVEITNIDQIATGSGAVQIISNTVGSTFTFNYQNVRWVITRNGVVLDYVDADPATLDISEYTVEDGLLKLGTSFPLTINDIVEIKPV